MLSPARPAGAAPHAGTAGKLRVVVATSGRKSGVSAGQFSACIRREPPHIAAADNENA